jgi:transcription antitermination factor NusG
VRPRFESIVQEKLVNDGLEVFLPCCHPQQNRRNTVEQTEPSLAFGYAFYRADSTLNLPAKPRRSSSPAEKEAPYLFPGYLFARFHVTEKKKILMVPGVMAIFNTEACTDTLEGELRTIRKIVQSDLAYKAEPTAGAGRSVRIENGPLTGLEGSFTSIPEPRIHVPVTVLGCSITVDIGAAVVKPVSSAKSHTA